MTNNGNCVSKNIAKDSDMWISMLNILFLTKKPVILKDVIQRTDTIQVCHGKINSAKCSTISVSITSCR